MNGPEHGEQVQPGQRIDGVEVDGTPAVVEGFHPLSMVYGGGGVFGIGYSGGVARGLEEGGIPVSRAPSLGTSAGAWTAAAVALGVAYDDVAALDAPSIPNLRPGVLAGLARRVFGEATHPLVSVSAVCLTSGRRHILDGGMFPLADLVAASSAVPGLLAPHRVGGNLYVDGGMWSTTSVDAARHAQAVIVIAPLAGPHVGLIGRGAGLLLQRELRGWRRRHPDRRIVMIRPERAMGRFVGRTVLSLFDAERARGVYPLAYEQGLRWAELLQRQPDR